MDTLKNIGYSEVFKIRTHETDLNKHIKITSLIQLLQEASMSNAIKLKVSVWDLEQSCLTWVLIKKEINIYHIPSIGDKIEVITYPSGFDKIFAYRDYIVKDLNNNVLVEASSAWVLMNTKTRKLVKSKMEIPIPNDVNILNRPAFNFSKFLNTANQKIFEANWFDLDWNNHVNNIFTIKCIVEGVSENKLRANTIKKIKINFKAESFLKDKIITSYIENNQNKTSHNIIRESDNKLIALAEIEWN